MPLRRRGRNRAVGVELASTAWLMKRTQKITPATPRRTKAIAAVTMMINTTKKKVLPDELLLLEVCAGGGDAGGLFPGWKTPPGGSIGLGCIGLGCAGLGGIGLGFGLNPGGLPPTGGAVGGFPNSGFTPLMNCTPHFGHFSGGKSPRPTSAPHLLHVQILTISIGPFGIPG